MTLRLLTVAEAADRLHMSSSWIKKLIQKKEIPVVKLGRAIRIDVSDLDNYIEKQKTTVGENVGGSRVPDGTWEDSGHSDVVQMTGGRRR